MKKIDFEQATKIREKIAKNEAKIKAIAKADYIIMSAGCDTQIDDPAIVDEVRKIVISRLREQNAALENEFASL